MRLGPLLILASVIGLVVPGLASGYGNGGNGDGGAGAELHEHASGRVSWIPNPNGKGVIEPSVWRGPRPAGPFEEDTSIQDALDELARGRGSTYSDEDVRKNMEWAKRAGVLRGIKIPPELIPYLQKASPQTSAAQSSTSPSSPPTRTSSGRQSTPSPRQAGSTPTTTQKTGTSRRAKRDARVGNYMTIGLNVWAWRNQRIKQGNPPTSAEIEAKVRTEVVKNKVQNLKPRDINKMVRKVKRFLRYFSY
jgi:hypothetical protein